MDIPKSFKLMAHTITVVEKKNMMAHEDSYGLSHYHCNRIEIEKDGMIQSNKEHTLMHELVHFVLHYMNRRDLNKDEEFIETFSGLLHQAISTMEF